MTIPTPMPRATASRRSILIQYLNVLGDISFLVLDEASSTKFTEMNFLTQTRAIELGVVTGFEWFNDFFLEPFGNGIVAASRAKDSTTGYDSTRDKNFVSQATMFCRKKFPIFMLSSNNSPYDLGGSKGEAEWELIYENGTRKSFNSAYSFRMSDQILYADLDARELVSNLSPGLSSLAVEFSLPNDFLGRLSYQKGVSPREVDFLRAAAKLCI